MEYVNGLHYISFFIIIGDLFEDPGNAMHIFRRSPVGQDAGSEQINRAIQQLYSITQQNSTTSEQLATTAEELSYQAQSLQQTIAFFQVDANDQVHQGENNNPPRPPKTNNAAAASNRPMMGRITR